MKYMKGETKNYITFGLALLFIVYGIISIVSAYSKQGYHEKLVHETQIKVSKLKDELNQLNIKDRANKEVINEVLHTASEAGSNVAELQTSYSRVSTLGERQDIANSIRSFMAKDSQNAVVPWFSRHTKDAYPKWTFESLYNFKDNQIDVLWKCVYGDDLLAYATGTFDAKANLFTNVKWFQTSLGSKMFINIKPDIKEADINKNKSKKKEMKKIDNKSLKKQEKKKGHKGE